jgi:hypothetical protein
MTCLLGGEVSLFHEMLGVAFGIASGLFWVTLAWQMRWLG